MAETETNTNGAEAVDRAAGATRRAAGAAAEAGRKTIDAAADAEQRSFAAAGDAAQTSLKAGRDLARSSQEAARRAADQASDFWRGAITPMAQLQNEFGRWIEQSWRQAGAARLQNASPLAGMLLAPFTGQPLADLHETDTALELRMELPGLKAEDIQLALQGDVLLVSGEKADGIDRGQGAYRISERRFGRFERAFPLPPEADRGHIDASFTDGLLKVTIAKSAKAAEAKTIPIKG